MSWLTDHSRDNNYIDTVERGDGTYVCLHRLMFHWTMIIGTIGDEIGYDDRYCYATYEKAKAALDDWQARNWEGEPTGWHRHPDSGRRRTDGDPATERVVL